MFNSTLDHPISLIFLFEEVVVINTFNKCKELMVLLSWSKTFPVMISFTWVLAALGDFDYATDLHPSSAIFQVNENRIF
jgi:hypothetical protein